MGGEEDNSTKKPRNNRHRKLKRMLKMSSSNEPRLRMRLRPVGILMTCCILQLVLPLLIQPTQGFLGSFRGIGLDGNGICSTDLRNCSCRSYTGSETEIDCPQTNPKVHLRIEPRQYAEVRCQRNGPHDVKLMPQLSIGATNRLTIDNCPFPLNESIMDFVSFLGSSEVKLLWLKNNANPEHNASLVKNHFAGMQDLERLGMSHVQLTNIEPDLFEHIPNLTWLDMRDNIVHLPATIFDSVPKLRILELSFNSLEELAPRLLRHLSNLRLLTLWHNKLRNITKRSFEGVPGLERLDLSANQLESIPADAFAHLPRLTELGLGFNNLGSLPEGLFDNNRELRKLKLASQRVDLHTLPHDLLQNLPMLEQVNLERIGLVNLPGTVFQGSVNVTDINLSFNRIKVLPDDLFRDQSALRTLLLQYNELSVLPDDLFQNTAELRVVRLSHNEILELSGALFRELHKLEELYLDNNRLQRIELHAFSRTKLLTVLHLQHNQLTFDSLEALPARAAEQIDNEPNDVTSMDEFDELEQDRTPFQHLHRLRELDLSFNWITAIPRDLMLNAHDLQLLNLTRNNITILTYANLQFLASAITIDLRNNTIYEIDIADMERLVLLENRRPEDGSMKKPLGRTRVLLNGNPLNCNCIVYTFVLYMQRKLDAILYDRLELVADKLACHNPEQLHGVLVQDVPTRQLLCNLDMSSTEIGHCPDICYCFIRPEDGGVIVDCSDGGLKEVPPLPRPSTFGYRFIELHVENNNISTLPDRTTSNDGWKDVRDLYVSNNKLETLREEQLPRGLRMLDVSRNRLRELSASVLEALARSPSLMGLRLGNNAWACHCDAAPFMTFVHANQFRIEDFRSLRCSDGRQLNHTSIGDFCNEQSYTIALICAIMSVILCLVALLSFVCYKYKLELKVWLFKHGLCMCWVAEEELDRDKQYDAFVSYSHKDEAFVADHLVPTLERDPMNFRICWHVRDWTPGEMISSQISNSVEQSRRTIIVLSSNFLESVWGQLEFRTAHLQSMAERRNRLIIVIFGDIGNIDDVEPELRAYLRTNTYVRWGDPWFWDKVRFAMPHPPKSDEYATSTDGNETLTGTRVSSVGTPGIFKGSTVDDKLELIKPETSPGTPPVLTTPPTEPSTAVPSNAGPFIISTERNTRLQNLLQQQLHPQQGSGRTNVAFVINSNAKQSDV